MRDTCALVMKKLNPHKSGIDFWVSSLINKNYSQSKLWSDMNQTKVSPNILLMIRSGNNFIFLPLFYLIMWVMNASKNFGKIASLKIWELISLGGVKTHFRKLALKWCSFRHEKINILANIVLLLLMQLRFRHTKHLKMTVSI